MNVCDSKTKILNVIFNDPGKYGPNKKNIYSGFLNLWLVFLAFPVFFFLKSFICFCSNVCFSCLVGRKWVDLLIDINTIRSRTWKIGAKWCFNVASRRSTYAFGAQHHLVKQSWRDVLAMKASIVFSNRLGVPVWFFNLRWKIVSMRVHSLDWLLCFEAWSRRNKILYNSFLAMFSGEITSTWKPWYFFLMWVCTLYVTLKSKNLNVGGSKTKKINVNIQQSWPIWKIWGPSKKIKFELFF